MNTTPDPAVDPYQEELDLLRDLDPADAPEHAEALAARMTSDLDRPLGDRHPREGATP